jgi:hypothetical protein
MRDIVESGPVRVVNWRMIRLFAGIACGFWGMTIAALVIPGWRASGDDIWLFALGCCFALAALVYWYFDQLKVERPPKIVKHN